MVECSWLPEASHWLSDAGWVIKPGTYFDAGPELTMEEHCCIWAAIFQDTTQSRTQTLRLWFACNIICVCFDWQSQVKQCRNNGPTTQKSLPPALCISDLTENAFWQTLTTCLIFIAQHHGDVSRLSLIGPWTYSQFLQSHTDRQWWADRLEDTDTDL